MQTEMPHPAEAVIALFATGDLPLWERIKTGIHVNRCQECRELAGVFRDDRAGLRESARELPAHLDWARLSQEMTANIHVGLAAGECVSPRESLREPIQWWSWKPAAMAAGLVLVFSVAWWLNMPSEDNAAFGRIYQAIVRGGRAAMRADEVSGPVVEASTDGIQYMENGAGIGVELSGAQPMSTLNVQGSASSRYVDDDTGQVTITTVYVQ